MSNLKEFQTIVDVLNHRSKTTPNQIAYTFLEGDDLGKEQSITYHDLHVAALCIAHKLSVNCNLQDRVVLFFPPGLGFIKAFYGCLYAGIIAVPSYPPKMNRSAERMKSILSDSKPTAILTESDAGYSKVLSKVDEAKNLNVLNIDELDTGITDLDFKTINPNNIAFLQYTSGSTGTPKGVMVNHHNLMDNLLQIKNVFGLSSNDILVGWLPAYHDMGLVGNILQAVFSGFRAILFAPVRFLKTPKCWLYLISKYKATVSGGPNFSYDLCCEIPNKELLEIDLSSWKVAFNGAEPISIDTLNKFTDKFKSFGFQESTFLPCYGMAETTLLVSSILKNQSIVSKTFNEKQLQFELNDSEEITYKNIELVSCGEVADSFDIKIIGKDGSEVSEGVVGEINLSGPSTTSGYWGKTSMNKEVFENIYGNKCFFKTGDLGLLSEGHLYITGRLKDLIIINGKNYYPQDIEAKIASYNDDIVNSSIAVFSIKINNNDKLVVVTECLFKKDKNIKEVVDVIQQNLAKDFNLFLYDIVLIRKGTILKTSSGKIQRSACRKSYLNNDFRVITSLKNEKELLSEKTVNKETSLSFTEKKLVNLFTKELNLESQISKTDNFLDYGLDSIIITRLILGIESTFEKELEFESVYLNNTITLLAEYIDNIEIKAQKESPKNSDVFLASQLQKSIFIKQQQNPNHTGYHIPIWLAINEGINFETVERSLSKLIKKHNVLRSLFELKEDEIYQRIQPKVEFQLNKYNSSNKFDQKQYSEKIAQKPFDLEKDLLIRSSLISLNNSNSLLIVIHHILLDARSVKIIVDELKDLLQKPTKESNENNKNNFYEYCLEELNYDDKLREKQKNFWLKEFETEPESFNLPKLNVIQEESIGRSLFFGIDDERLSKLNTYANSKNVNLFSILITSYFLTLHILSGNTDIVVGVPISLRDKKKFQNSIGLFINTLMFRGIIDPNTTFKDLISSFYKKSRDLISYANYPFQNIIENKNSTSNSSGLGITKVFFNFLNHSDGLSETLFEEFYQENFNLNLNFDLNLYVLPLSDEIQFRLDYDTSSFSLSGIQNIVSIYTGIIDFILLNSNQLVKDFTIDSFIENPEIKNHTLFSQSEKKNTVWEKFTDTANLYKEQVCIKGVDKEYTYSDVLNFANAISYKLYESLNFQSQKNIGLCFGHHENMIFSMLASLKLGQAYVPVDFSLPNERKKFIFQDAGIDILLTDNANYNEVKSFVQEIKFDAVIINVDESNDNAQDQKTIKNASVDSLAYILYTSGSTGTPKGVMQNQGYIMHIAYSLINSLSITNEDCISLIPTFNFSASMMDVFAALLSGASLKIIDIKKNGLTGLVNAVKESEITIYHSVPSVYRSFVEELLQNKDTITLSKLRYIYLAGEPLLRNDVNVFKTTFQDSCILVNALGCTEFNVCSQYFIDKNVDIKTPYVPLGYNGLGVEVVIFDENKNIINGFGEGEIVIKSNYLSKGYWNLPELTNDKFIEISGDSYYFTGDLGRRLPDGRLLHLGRKDFQIKLRGQRIELGEIESQLQKTTNVKRAVVVVKEINNSSTLCAYLTGNSNIDIHLLRAKVSESLPKYMLPQHYIIMESFPLTISGKVDRKKLPNPILKPSTFSGTKIDENNSRALKLKEIWSNVLKTNVDEINTASDFFTLGGDSLKAIQLISRIRESFNSDLGLDFVFNNSCFNEILAYVENKKSDNVESKIIALNSNDNKYKLTPGQQSIWLYSQFTEASLAYNLCGLYKIDKNLDIELLKKSIHLIYEKYDILRACFNSFDGNTLMEIVPLKLFEIEKTFDYESLHKEKEIYDLAKKHHSKVFDLSQAPLCNFKLFKVDNSFYLSYKIHHIIADGWSAGVMINTILSYYNNLKDPSFKNDVLDIQFYDYAHWVNNKAINLEDSKNYWSTKLRGYNSEIKWANSYHKKALKRYSGNEVSYEIENNVYENLKALATKNDCTMFMIVMSLLGIYFKKYSSNEDIVLGTDFSGRNSKQIENQIGYFLKLIPLRLSFEGGNKTIVDVLNETKTTILEAFKHQDYPIESIIKDLKDDNNTITELFNVLVLYQNFNNSPSFDEIEGALSIEPIEIKNQNALIDLTLEFIEIEDSLKLKIRYKSDIFEHWQIEAMFNQISFLFNEAVNNEYSEIDTLNIHRPEELLKLNKNTDGTDCDYLFNTIREFSRKKPQKSALICEERKVSYFDLYNNILSISKYLLENTSEGEPIGIFMQKDEKAIMTLLSILYAGRVFVPLDINQPNKRIQHIINDVDINLIISDVVNSKQIDAKVEHIDYQKILNTTKNLENLNICPQASNLAYILYTSGTTGLPKGVMISRSSLAHYVDAFQDYFNLTNKDHVIQQASLSFDTAIEEIFPILSVGGSLDIIVDGGKDIKAIVESIEQREATVLSTTPLIINELNNNDFLLNNLNIVISGGDVLKKEHIDKLVSKVKIYNTYGPTETTVCATYRQIKNFENFKSIGKVIKDKVIVITDEFNNRLPVGVIGEILIGGKGVFEGYINQKEKTANSFLKLNGSNYYRTGDLGYTDNKNEIIFIGRKDDQIKIRGQRVNLNEISSLVSSYNKGIRESCVIFNNDTKAVIAYLSLEEESFNFDMFLKYLEENLPQYMIPNKFYNVESNLPYSLNGKVDIKKLIKEEYEILTTSLKIILPNTETEKVVLSIWQRFLKLEKISVDSNFFHIGGDSLLLGKIKMELEEEFNFELGFKELFEANTISSLSKLIDFQLEKKSKNKVKQFII